MDSGNSGSVQSSSGGEEEFDSRAESISSLFNSSNQISRNMMLNPPPSSSHHHSLHQAPFFDSFPNFLNTSPPPPLNTNSFLNLDMTWARSLPSQPNCTDISALIRPPSSPATTVAGLQGPNPPSPYMGPSISLPPRSENESRSLPSATSDDQLNTTRSSKKRSRASRRAPTTVLTTDTSNFRAMVQEFTGIPAPPFSAAASFAQSRLNLFGTALALRSGLPNPPPPPYLLRPFAHKVTPQPSFTSFPLTSSSSSSSSFLDVLSSSTAGNSVSTSTNAACNSSTVAPNYQLPSDLGLPKLLQQHQSQLENSMFTIQSLLRSSPKYPLAQGPIADGRGEFPMNHGHLDANRGSGTHTNLIASDGMPSRTNDHPSWGDGSSGDDRSHLRPFDWNCSNSQKLNGCKINYTPSTSSDFHVEKGSENVSSRGEGTVESWIFSSD